MESVADRYIAAVPTVPEGVWLASGHLTRAAATTYAHLIPAGARLVVVAPHPDDELLSCGGLLQLHASHGGEVLVVGVTDGEASHGVGTAGDRQRLALRRAAERHEGLARLGLNSADSLQLRLPDGHVVDHQTTLVTRLLFLLRDTDHVVTCWRLDGHPDHEAVGAACAVACAIVRSHLIEAPVWMWHWAELNDSRVPWNQLHRIALPKQYVDRKVHALAAHQSQLESRNVDEGPVLDGSIMRRQLRWCEYFFIENGRCGD